MTLRLKDIKAFRGTDITDRHDGTAERLKKAEDFQEIGCSYGTYGVNGCLFYAEGEYWKITARSTNIFAVL